MSREARFASRVPFRFRGLYSTLSVLNFVDHRAALLALVDHLAVHIHRSCKGLQVLLLRSLVEVMKS